MKIKIAGKYIEHYNDVSIDTSLDAVASTFSFTAKYDCRNAFHKEIFKPLTYYRIEFLNDNGRPFSTGTITTIAFNSKAAPELVQVSGYSLGGVLEDCNIPYELYPLESNNRTLKEISERLLNYFGIPLVVYQEVTKECNQIIPKSVAEPQDTIKDYLSKVAAQKKVVLSHDVYGNVIMFRPKVNSASKGLYTRDNTEEMSLSVDGQAMHSSITTLRQPSRPKKGSTDILSDDYDPLEGSGSDLLGSKKSKKKILLPVDTVYNPLLKVKRPKVDKLSSGDVADTLQGAENSIANELKAISVSFTIPRWDSVSIGDIIEVQNEEIYLEKPLRMMVYNTVINESNEVKNSTITCVLPGTFTGVMPKTVFS